MRKGQITIFVIVGIAIIIVFALGFFIRTLYERPISTPDGEVASFKKSIDSYVTDCLFLVSQEAIKKSGEQGGDLYDADPSCPATGCLCTSDSCTLGERNYATDIGINGVNYLKSTIGGKQYKVSYGIARNTQPPITYHYSDSTYPAVGFVFSPNQVDFSEYFGDNTLRKVCDRFGMNQPGQGKIAIPCPGYAYDSFPPAFPPLNNYSMQEQIGQYIGAHIGACAKLEDYMKQGVRFTLGEPTASVIIGDNDVSVILNYSISMQERKSNTSSMLFRTTIPVRLKTVWQYAYVAIQKEITDLSFNIGTADTQGFGEMLNGFSLQRFTDAGAGCLISAETKDTISGNSLTPPNYNCQTDDIIRITDSKSILFGEPFILQFAIQNRRPVLNPINSRIWPNMIQYCENLDVPLIVTDPDEDVLTMTFQGVDDNEWSYNCFLDTFATCELSALFDWNFRPLPNYTQTHPSNTWKINGILVDLNTVTYTYTPPYSPLNIDKLFEAKDTDSERGMTIKVSDISTLSDSQIFNYECCQPDQIQMETCFNSVLTNWN